MYYGREHCAAVSDNHPMHLGKHSRKFCGKYGRFAEPAGKGYKPLYWQELPEPPEELMIQNPDGLLIPQTKEERDMLERHLSHLDKPNVKQLLQEFFDILDTVEVSDSGREFNPVYISSCRVELTQRISEVMKGLKEYADEV